MGRHRDNDIHLPVFKQFIGLFIIRTCHGHLEVLRCVQMGNHLPGKRGTVIIHECDFDSLYVHIGNDWSYKHHHYREEKDKPGQELVPPELDELLLEQVFQTSSHRYSSLSLKRFVEAAISASISATRMPASKITPLSAMPSIIILRMASMYQRAGIT